VAIAKRYLGDEEYFVFRSLRGMFRSFWCGFDEILKFINWLDIHCSASERPSRTHALFAIVFNQDVADITQFHFPPDGYQTGQC